MERDKSFELHFPPVLTSNVSGGSKMPTRSPNQVSVASRKCSSAMKAIRFAAMLAISEMARDAPCDAASMMFRSELKWRKNGRVKRSKT